MVHVELRVESPHIQWGDKSVLINLRILTQNGDELCSASNVWVKPEDRYSFTKVLKEVLRRYRAPGRSRWNT